MCKDFVHQSLNETLTATGVADIVDYNFYPWGNAYYNTSECGTSSYDKAKGMTCWEADCGGDSPSADCYKGDILCQHGSEECLLNKIEACAVYLFPDNVMGVAEFTYCLETEFMPTYRKCAESTGLDYPKIT